MDYTEHTIKELEDYEDLTRDRYEFYFPKKRDDQLCYSVWKEDGSYKISTGYFIGIDWIEERIKHTTVRPKLNFDNDGIFFQEVDYLKMLFRCLKYSETAEYISELIFVKWTAPQIEIEQKHDMLTPFIIIDFLNVVKKIVRKGLKKSYYKTTQTLNGRIKGKMLINRTVNLHLSKGNILNNVCTYDEFGVNNKENQLLKKAINFIKVYISNSPLLKDINAVSEMIGYLSPAFEPVSSNINVDEIKQIKSNRIFKEYDKGIRLAKMILKRFAYNISNTSKEKILTPPFWIDMPMLFELHTLSLLKDCFGDDVRYHPSTYGNELDFLLKSDDTRMVIDAKYIPSWKWNTKHENIRQVSGYARLNKVSELLDYGIDKNIDCLIIYPDTKAGIQSFDINKFREKLTPIKAYNGIYKLGITIPLIEKS